MGLFIVPYIIIFGPILLPGYILDRFIDNIKDTFEYITGGFKFE